MGHFFAYIPFENVTIPKLISPFHLPANVILKYFYFLFIWILHTVQISAA